MPLRPPLGPALTSYPPQVPPFADQSNWNGYSAPPPYNSPYYAHPNPVLGFQPYRPTVQPHIFTPQTGLGNSAFLPNGSVRPPAFYQQQNLPVYHQQSGFVPLLNHHAGQMYQQPYGFQGHGATLVPQQAPSVPLPHVGPHPHLQCRMCSLQIQTPIIQIQHSR